MPLLPIYEDIPYWKLLERSFENTLQKHPLRYPIAGTVDSIRKITKEDLYTCYDTFYHPSNMFMTVVGNVDPKEVIETIQNNQAKKDYQSREPVKIKQVTEPDTVVKKEDTVTSDNVEIPKLSIAYKIPVRDFDKQKFHFFLNFYFDLRLGSTSLLLERLRKELAITGEISVDVMEADQHFVCVVSVETKKPEYVCEEIDKELRLKQVSEEEFNRKRKTLKSGCVYQSDSVYTIASHVNSQLLRMNTILLDEYAWIDSLKWKEFQKAIQSLPLENRSVVTLLKKSESL